MEATGLEYTWLGARRSNARTSTPLLRLTRPLQHRRRRRFLSATHDAAAEEVRGPAGIAATGTTRVRRREPPDAGPAGRRLIVH
jgi:hypothetical protein